MVDSSTESASGRPGRRRGRALAAAVAAALVAGVALLTVGCAPEQKASASQAGGAPAAVAQGASSVRASSPSLEMATLSLSDPADSAPDASFEATPPAVPDGQSQDLHAVLTDRFGDRAADDALLAAQAVSVADKQANAQALSAAQADMPVVYSLAFSTGFQEAPPTPRPATPTPKPVVRAATPRPLTSSGGWVELPNVRPIPSTYYAAVHRWDSIVNHFAGVYKIDPDLIRRIIYVESKGYQYAYVASTGVKGLMQITPMWFQAGENPYDPYTNIGKGSYILRRGYDAYHTWFLAVTYFCYGPLGRFGGNVPTMYAGLVFSPIIRSL